MMTTMMTVSQYHIHSGLGSDTIRRYCREGKIPYLKVDKYYIDWQKADTIVREMAMNKLKNRPTNYHEAVKQMKQDALSM